MAPGQRFPRRRRLSLRPLSRRPHVLLAIADIYRQHGYLDVEVTSEVTPSRIPGAMVVTFRIVEGRQSKIHRVDLVGVTAIAPDPLRRSLFARKNKAFNPYFLIADT